MGDIDPDLKNTGSIRLPKLLLLYTTWALYNIAVLSLVVWLCFQAASLKRDLEDLRDSYQLLNEQGQRPNLEQKSSAEKGPARHTELSTKNQILDYGLENQSSRKREVLSLNQVDLSSLIHGRDGQPGLPGQQGIQGPPGIPGKDGAPGRDAVNFLSINHLINTTITQLAAAEMEKIRMRAQDIPTVAGSVYIRWGKTSCRDRSSLLMSGRMGGAYYSYSGGSGQYVCLPDDPEYNPYISFTKIGNYIYSTEFEASDRSIHHHDAPCAVCLADTRTSQVMLSAKLRCPDSSWTKEYSGYLMSESYDHASASGYICMDENPEPLPGMSADNGGALLYHVGVDCSKARGNFGYCPPYHDDKPLSCVVCSK